MPMSSQDKNELEKELSHWKLNVDTNKTAIQMYIQVLSRLNSPNKNRKLKVSDSIIKDKEILEYVYDVEQLQEFTEINTFSIQHIIDNLLERNCITIFSRGYYFGELPSYKITLIGSDFLKLLQNYTNDSNFNSIQNKTKNKKTAEIVAAICFFDNINLEKENCNIVISEHGLNETAGSTLRSKYSLWQKQKYRSEYKNANSGNHKIRVLKSAITFLQTENGIASAKVALDFLENQKQIFQNK